MWSSIHANQSRLSFGRYARSGTRDARSELASLAPKAGSTKRDGPSDRPPHEFAHDTRPASAPDAEVPSGSGSGGGRADHDPNGMRAHVRLQEVQGRSHKAGTFAPMFPGEATENLAPKRSRLPAGTALSRSVSGSVVRLASGSGAEQRRRYDGDPIRAAVGVRPGGDHDRVEQVAPDLLGEPVEVAQGAIVGLGGELCLDREDAAVATLHDQVNLVVAVAGPRWLTRPRAAWA